MTDTEIKKKLEDYNNILCKHNPIEKAQTIAVNVAWIFHIIMLIPFVGEFLSFLWKNLAANFIIQKSTTVLTFFGYSETVISFILYIIMMAYIFPLLVGLIVYVIAKKLVTPEISALSNVKSPFEIAKTLCGKFAINEFNLGKTATHTIIYSFIIMPLFSTVLVFMNSLVLNNSTETIMHSILAFISCALFLLIIYACFYLFLLMTLCRNSSKHWQVYFESKKSCEKLLATLELEALEKRQKAENDRKKREAEEREAEKARKKMEAEERERARREEVKKAYIEKEKARREEAERIRKIAEQAEQEWHSLESPETNETLVEKLAKSGSPSACAYLGEKLTEEYTKKIYTKSEKENIYKQAIQYLAVSDTAGNIDSRFLYLALSVQEESYSLYSLDTILSELRSIQKSDNFNNNHIYPCENVISYVINEIDDVAAKEKERKKNAEKKKGESQPPHTPPRTNPHTPYNPFDCVGYDIVSGLPVYKDTNGNLVGYSGDPIEPNRVGGYYPY